MKISNNRVSRYEGIDPKGTVERTIVTSATATVLGSAVLTGFAVTGNTIKLGEVPLGIPIEHTFEWNDQSPDPIAAAIESEKYGGVGALKDALLLEPVLISPQTLPKDKAIRPSSRTFDELAIAQNLPIENESSTESTEILKSAGVNFEVTEIITENNQVVLTQQQAEATLRIASAHNVSIENLSDLYNDPLSSLSKGERELLRVLLVDTKNVVTTMLLSDDADRQLTASIYPYQNGDRDGDVIYITEDLAENTQELPVNGVLLPVVIPVLKRRKKSYSDYIIQKDQARIEQYSADIRSHLESSINATVESKRKMAEIMGTAFNEADVRSELMALYVPQGFSGYGSGGGEAVYDKTEQQIDTDEPADKPENSTPAELVTVVDSFKNPSVSARTLNNEDIRTPVEVTGGAKDKDEKEAKQRRKLVIPRWLRTVGISTLLLASLVDAAPSDSKVEAPPEEPAKNAVNEALTSPEDDMLWCQFTTPNGDTVTFTSESREMESLEQQEGNDEPEGPDEDESSDETKDNHENESADTTFTLAEDIIKALCTPPSVVPGRDDAATLPLRGVDARIRVDGTYVNRDIKGAVPDLTVMQRIIDVSPELTEPQPDDAIEIAPTVPETGWNVLPGMGGEALLTQLGISPEKWYDIDSILLDRHDDVFYSIDESSVGITKAGQLPEAVRKSIIELTQGDS